MVAFRAKLFEHLFYFHVLIVALTRSKFTSRDIGASKWCGLSAATPCDTLQSEKHPESEGTTVYRNAYVFCFLVIAVAGQTGCSSEPSGKESKKAAAAPDKIHGKAQVVLNETSSSDVALNGGGPSVYLVDGMQRYRLFFNTSIPVEPDKEYVAEGVNAQKAIDELGDPDQGKNGYPLQASCDHVVRMAWPGLAFDVTDLDITSLCGRVKRYPARPVFLVTRLTLAAAAPAKEGGADSAEAKKQAEENDAPEVSVPADKQRALLVSGPTTIPAPLWEPGGGTARCKVAIFEGKVTELDTGTQLCEIVPWSQFSYQPTAKGGHPVKVRTEVEVKFDPRK